ncbi:MAG: hypothetical protein ACI4CA_06300 [Bacteroides sp.]
MKKLFICMVLAMMAIGIDAQTTWNVRVGGGYMKTSFYDWYGGDYATDDAFGALLAVEANIPFKNQANRWTFSPSLLLSYDLGDIFEFVAPLQIGHKVAMTRGSLFFPKFGVAVGAEIGGEETLIVGPSAELAFEIKHFVFAINSYYGLNEPSRFNAFASFGYKF